MFEMKGNNIMELGLSFTLCSISSVFFLITFLLMFMNRNREKKCTAHTDGLVIDIKAKSAGDDGMTFQPICEYYVQGIRYERIGVAKSHHVPAIHTIVSIMYHPHDPKQSYILDYDEKGYRILSIVFAVLGLIPLILCILLAFLLH